MSSTLSSSSEVLLNSKDQDLTDSQFFMPEKLTVCNLSLKPSASKRLTVLECSIYVSQQSQQFPQHSVSQNCSCEDFINSVQVNGT